MLGIGLLLVGGSALVVAYLNRPPTGEAKVHFDQAEFDRGMRQLLEKKNHCGELTRTALKRDRPRFEAIVKAVEKQGLSEDQSEWYSYPKEGSPDQLTKVDQSFDRAELGEFCEKNTLVEADRRKGILFIKVVICEMGHAGTYAVMYSSKELTTKEIEDQLVPHAVEQIDPHWWAVIEWY